MYFVLCALILVHGLLFLYFSLDSKNSVHFTFSNENVSIFYFFDTKFACVKTKSLKLYSSNHLKLVQFEIQNWFSFYYIITLSLYLLSSTLYNISFKYTLVVFNQFDVNSKFPPGFQLIFVN